jgi:protein-tyrosine phosphatase
MDAENVAELVAMAPPGHAAKISRILDFAALEEADVPDPYYGGHEGFDEVLGLIDAGLAGLMRHVGGG